MSSDAPLISVVIPAYMAGASIGRTLESVAAQRFDDMEVLVVDDGSSDNTAGVARSFDRRINLTVYESEINRGVAAVFTRAVSMARGRYICRIDADDTIPEGLFASVAGMLRSGDIDLLRGGYNRITPDGRSRYVPVVRVTDLNDFKINVDHFSLWCKFIRTSLLKDVNNILFVGIDCWEDLGVISRIFARRLRVVDVDRPFYNYYISAKGMSLSNSGRQRLLNDHLEMARCLDLWFRERGLSARYDGFLAHLKFAAKVKMLRGRGRDVRRWKETFPEVNGRVMSLRHFSLGHRLLFAAVANLPARLCQSVSDLCDRLF